MAFCSPILFCILLFLQALVAEKSIGKTAKEFVEKLLNLLRCLVFFSTWSGIRGRKKSRSRFCAQGVRFAVTTQACLGQAIFPAKIAIENCQVRSLQEENARVGYSETTRSRDQATFDLFQMAIRLSLHAQLIAAQGHPCFSFLQSSQCRSHEISPAARPAATSSALLLSRRFVEPTRVITQKRGALLTKSGGGGGSGGSDSSSKSRLQRDQEAFAQEWCR